MLCYALDTLRYDFIQHEKEMGGKIVTDFAASNLTAVAY